MLFFCLCLALLLVIRTGLWLIRQMMPTCEQVGRKMTVATKMMISSRELYIKEKCFPVDNNKTNMSIGTPLFPSPSFFCTVETTKAHSLVWSY